MDLTTSQHPSIYAGCRGVEDEIQPIFQPMVLTESLLTLRQLTHSHFPSKSVTLARQFVGFRFTVSGNKVVL